MNHDPNNKDCPCNSLSFVQREIHQEPCPACTCPPATTNQDDISSKLVVSPPAVDEQMDMNSTDAMYWAEQLVKTLDEHPHINFRDTGWLMGWFANYWAAVHDPLARIVDQLRDELAAEKAKETECFQPIRDSLKQQLITNAFLLGNAEQTIADLHADLATAQRELERVRGWIEENTNCSPDCTFWVSDDDDCSCGRQKALQEPTK